MRFKCDEIKRVLVLGYDGVGKSTLIASFAENKQSESVKNWENKNDYNRFKYVYGFNFDSTSVITHINNKKIGVIFDEVPYHQSYNQVIEILLSNSAGNEYQKPIDAIIVAIDSTNARSLYRMRAILELLNSLTPNINILVALTKVDIKHLVEINSADIDDTVSFLNQKNRCFCGSINFSPEDNTSLISAINNNIFLSPLKTSKFPTFTLFGRPQYTGKIPKLIHLIWLGCDLPDVYKNIPLLWKELNPDFDVILWVSNLAGKNIQEISEKNNITVVNMQDCQNGLENFDLIVSELGRKRTNYSAAADILKIDIITMCGGFYFDIGITPNTSILNAVDPEADFITPLDYVLNYGQRKFIGNNDIYAATPGHEIFRRAQYTLRLINRFLHDRQRDDLLDCSDPHFAYITGRTRTGKAVPYALEALDYQGETYGIQTSSGKHTLRSSQIGHGKSDERKIPLNIWKEAISAESELNEEIHSEVLFANLIPGNFSS